MLNVETPEKEILWAAVKGETALVKSLLEQNPQLAFAKDADGYSPLHRACYENHYHIAQLLLEHGADISARTNQDWQPLHSACKWNSSQCVTLLLDWGADVNAITHGGLTPLHLAASNPIAYETLVLLLNHPLISPHILSSNQEPAQEIAARCGPFSKLFSINHHAINEI